VLTRSAHVYVWDTTVNEGPVCRGSLNTDSHSFEHGDINAQFSTAVVTSGTTVYRWNFRNGSDSLIERRFVVDESDGNKDGTDTICDVSLTVRSETLWTIALINGRGAIFVQCAFHKAKSELRCIRRHHRGLGPPKIAISASGSVISSSNGSDIRIWIWSASDAILMQTIPKVITLNSNIAFFPDDRALAT
jgi:hypothetical protein